MSAQSLAHYRELLHTHTDDPVRQACPVCGEARCAEWRYAYERLVCAGEVPGEPAA